MEVCAPTCANYLDRMSPRRSSALVSLSRLLRPSILRAPRRLLYGKGELFACRHCYGLTYASQREPSHLRGFGKAQKIRMRLGGGPESEEFPDKPKGMHWRT